MKQRVKDWIKNGELFSEAVNIAFEIALNPFFIESCKNNKILEPFLKSAILTKLDFSDVEVWSIRDDFPFLRNSDCPLEIKALITDKFSTFYLYKRLHKQLFDCVSVNDCAKISSDILSSFMENRMIWKELEYYKEHHKVLGKHPRLAHYKELKCIEKLSIKDLILLESKLRHNIWRIKSEIDKGDKPYLLEHRKESLICKNNELQFVQDLIK